MDPKLFRDFWKDLLRVIEQFAWSEIGGKDHPASDRYHITRRLLDQNYIPKIDKIANNWGIENEYDLDQYLDWLDQQISIAKYWANQDLDKFYFDTVTYRQYFESINMLKQQNYSKNHSK